MQRNEFLNNEEKKKKNKLYEHVYTFMENQFHKTLIAFSRAFLIFFLFYFKKFFGLERSKKLQKAKQIRFWRKYW